MKVVKPVPICADLNPKDWVGSSEERKWPQPQSSRSWADFLLNFPPQTPACHQVGPQLPAFVSKVQRELPRLHYLGKKLMVAATAVLFLSGSLQGRFKVKGNLRLQQVPRPPPGWALPQAGWASLGPALKGPGVRTLFESEEKKRRGLSISLHLLEVKEQHSNRQRQTRLQARGAEGALPLSRVPGPLPGVIVGDAGGSTHSKAQRRGPPGH